MPRLEGTPLPVPFPLDCRTQGCIMLLYFVTRQVAPAQDGGEGHIPPRQLPLAWTCTRKGFCPGFRYPALVGGDRDQQPQG